MNPLVAFAVLPGGDHGPPRRILHRDSAAIEPSEILRAKLRGRLSEMGLQRSFDVLG